MVHHSSYAHDYDYAVIGVVGRPRSLEVRNRAPAARNREAVHTGLAVVPAARILEVVHMGLAVAQVADSRVVGHRLPAAVQEVHSGEAVVSVCNLVVRTVVQTAAVLPMAVRPLA